ncbi:NAD(P)H-hydrate epimerase [Bifidobacterium psychraerophilum]
MPPGARIASSERGTDALRVQWSNRAIVSAKEGDPAMVSLLFDDDAQALEAFLTEAFSERSIRDLEAPLLHEGVPLMRQAASAVIRTAALMIAHTVGPLSESRVVVLAGAGNNGADGTFAAAGLASAGAHTTLVAVGKTLDDEALVELSNSDAYIVALDEQARIPGVTAPRNAEERSAHMDEAMVELGKADLIIDAMTGIGLKGALRGIPAEIAGLIGETEGLPDRIAFPHGSHIDDSRMVLAVDTPSGVGVDDGSLPGPYIPADVTVSFGALKPCALLPPSSYACGQLVLVDFDFETERSAPVAEVMTARKSAQSIRLPRVNDSKYTRSVLGLVTGSQRYPGAGMLSTLAGARSNVGMVRYIGPPQLRDRILQILPEAVFESGRVQAWTLGSGLPVVDPGQEVASDDGQASRIGEILSSYDATGSSADAISQEGSGLPPVVVDAGALDIMPEHVTSLVVITPHAGELARLLQARGEDVDSAAIASEPLRWATRAWELTGATVLLKGAITVIVGDDGSGLPRVITVGRAPAWLSTAGAGDVLAGTLGAVLAQNADNLIAHPDLMPDYVAAGAYVHALAASLASESAQFGWSLPVLYDGDDVQSFSEDLTGRLTSGSASDTPSLGHPVTASDVIDALPKAFSLLAGLYDDSPESEKPDSADDRPSPFSSDGDDDDDDVIDDGSVDKEV